MALESLLMLLAFVWAICYVRIYIEKFKLAKLSQPEVQDKPDWFEQIARFHKTGEVSNELKDYFNSINTEGDD